MLKDQMLWLTMSERISDEIKQSDFEGRMIDGLREKAEEILQMENGEEKEKKSRKLLEELENAPQRPDFSYIEPEAYTDIEKLLPVDSNKKYNLDPENVRDKVQGAWYGRAIGCMLGIPIEGWTREKINSFVRESGQYPVTGFFHSNVGEEIREKYNINDVDYEKRYDRPVICWKNNVQSFPVDDDINYTVMGLRLIESYGKDFSSEDVMENWLLSIPVLHACTAERVAIQNTLSSVYPTKSGSYLNPYREWIGAQIRADFFGYINPGNPKEAAAMAYREGSVSHTKNGIYGEMYVSAMISLAFVSTDALWICKEALKQIPPKSRLAESIHYVIDMKEKGASFEEVIDTFHGAYNETEFYGWCHVIPNAVVVVASILWSDDYSQGIINSVLAGFDTDCNGATVGSILGVMNGFQKIDTMWLDDIEPILNTSVNRYNRLSIEEVVDRTITLLS